MTGDSKPTRCVTKIMKHLDWPTLHHRRQIAKATGLHKIINNVSEIPHCKILSRRHRHLEPTVIIKALKYRLRGYKATCSRASRSPFLFLEQPKN